ncbi:MAG: DUF4230 domain-containing protein [Defluviitaleaceae bacterium]|nr:DUF4230 domain-containing protein [Defluviitaleaceae bacterium]
MNKKSKGQGQGQVNPNPVNVSFNQRFSLKTILFSVLILLLLSYIVVSWFLDRVPAIEKKEAIDSGVLEYSVKEIGDLATLSYSYETIVVINDQNTIEIFGKPINIPGTARSLIITFEGRMRFGINMDEINISITERDENKFNVLVTLPNPTIQTHEIDMESIKILDEKTGIFVNFVLEDYAHFIADRQQYVETRSATLNLIGQAKDSAQRSIYVFLSSVLDSEFYIIGFNWK